MDDGKFNASEISNFSRPSGAIDLVLYTTIRSLYERTVFYVTGRYVYSMLCVFKT